ncbi:hypothetical protein [Calothrix sp. NIES-3974]|uniref:hypothetical protein n=1 Tax=Calothrix sp. NIES-3974 TaxID=2005462 RepID=UPI000B6056E0|nr:hypothetical protein [Calothrix sp. NIES-3974]BAZ05580.1 nuclear transport factor 2 [Calothrix sp. NIES-3974]
MISAIKNSPTEVVVKLEKPPENKNQLITNSGAAISQKLEAPRIALDYVVGSYFDSINQGLYRRTVSLFTNEGILAPPFQPQIIGRKQIYQYFQRQPPGLYLEVKERHISPFYNHRTKIDVFGKLRSQRQDINVVWTFLLNNQAKITIAQTVLLASLRELENLHSYPCQDFHLDCVEPEYLGGQACLRLVNHRIQDTGHRIQEK